MLHRGDGRLPGVAGRGGRLRAGDGVRSVAASSCPGVGGNHLLWEPGFFSSCSGMTDVLSENHMSWRMGKFFKRCKQHSDTSTQMLVMSWGLKANEMITAAPSQALRCKPGALRSLRGNILIRTDSCSNLGVLDLVKGYLPVQQRKGTALEEGGFVLRLLEPCEFGPCPKV